MTDLLPNDWDRIRRFYRVATPLILAERRDEWALDPYAWDNGMLHMTPIERWLWYDIRQCNAIIYPQYPVGRYFVDFANPVAKVAIECDGRAYHRDLERDARRQEEIEALGWSVYRISGSDCRTEYDEETGEAGRAHVFVDRICSEHGISRNSSCEDSDAWALAPACALITPQSVAECLRLHARLAAA